MLAGVLQPLADRGDPRYEPQAACLLAGWLEPWCKALPAHAMLQGFAGMLLSMFAAEYCQPNTP